MSNKVLVALVTAMLLASSLAYGDFSSGMAAYNAHNYPAALAQLKPEAESGNRIAQNIMGVIYMNALGVPRDDAAAMKWYRLAADQGYAVAQTNVGFLYNNGRGVERNQSEARRWFEKAAAQSDSRAITFLKMIDVKERTPPPAIGVQPPQLTGQGSISIVGHPAQDDDSTKPPVVPAINEESAETVRLASQYVASRPGLLGGVNITVQGPISLDKNTASILTIDILRRMKRESDWNKDNPEWKRLAAIIEKDLAKIRVESNADSHKGELAKRIDGIFIHGLASRLSSHQLGELVKFYSKSPGTEFANVQIKMIEEVLFGIASIQEQAAAGQRFLSKQSPGAKNENDFRELAGLFDEVVRIQLGALDPGPGHDRSGLQAIPMVMLMGIEANYAKINTLWKSIPEQGRAAIIAWRSSSLAKAEREALYESAKGVRTIVDMENEVKLFEKMMKKYEIKWRAELKQ